MAPFRLIQKSLEHIATSQSVNSTQSFLRNEFRDPGDVLSILLLLGPEVIQDALAQTAGSGVAPVAFSFGWVAYAVKALLSAFGDGRLMPTAENSALVIGAKSGHRRTNQSWVIGRLLRDFEARTNATIDERTHPTNHANRRFPFSSSSQKTPWESLRVTVFKNCKRSKNNYFDRAWISGFLTIFLQIGISIIPWVLDDDWAITLFTIGGTVLALAQSAFPQWELEKWSYRRGGTQTVSITQGDGSRHVMVILESDNRSEEEIDLEIMASGSKRLSVSNITRIGTSILTGFWVLLLFLVAEMTNNTWYLLAIGIVGMIQNLFTAGAKRPSKDSGIDLEFVETITDSSVYAVLRKVESSYPYVGTSLVPVFYPGGMRIKEEDRSFWENAESLRNTPNAYPSWARLRAPVDRMSFSQLSSRSSNLSGRRGSM